MTEEIHRGGCHCGRVAFEAVGPLLQVSSFYVPRSDPDKVDVNARCVDGVDPDALEVVRFDGRNWEEAFRRERG